MHFTSLSLKSQGRNSIKQIFQDAFLTPPFPPYGSCLDNLLLTYQARPKLVASTLEDPAAKGRAFPVHSAE